ncbi:hypothetical protein A2686_01530 [Candidatus Woesebacteria bacterium RIFCSPHIGHO2_01_FULL_38_10]|nr:MAG: hypothetical protein A2686_01530 [Candidatus Woesebacteria bacterium RIFCSPHIGHO2_01_FULL_38_10]
MANIIAFEGIPGAGKTTAINTLLKNGSLFNCAVVPELYMGKLDSLSGSKSYLDAEIDKSSIINDTKNHYDNILLDRTFLSTIAYCYAKSKVDGDASTYLDLLRYFKYLDSKHNLIRPTCLFYLNITIPESIKRREKFSKIDELHNWFDPEFLKHFSEFYDQKMNRFNMPGCILIDTTNLSKGSVTKKIMSILKK